MAPRRSRRARRSAARPRRPQLSEATRTALFVYASATDAGFEFRDGGHGRLEIAGPPGVDPTDCEDTVDAIRKHGAEIQRLVRWFNDEARQGRFWMPRPEPGGRQ